MQLQLSDRWRIRTDAYNWMLEHYAKRRKKPGDEDGEEIWIWTIEGYYGSLSALLKGMVSLDIRETAKVSRLRDLELQWHKVIDDLPAKLRKAAKEAQKAKPPKPAPQGRGDSAGDGAA